MALTSISLSTPRPEPSENIWSNIAASSKAIISITGCAFRGKHHQNSLRDKLVAANLEVEDGTILIEAKDRLDTFDFNGHLQSVQIKWEKGLVATKNCYGYTSWFFPNDGNPPYILISVDPNPYPDNGSFSKECIARHILGTVCHECVHAYILTYCSYEDLVANVPWISEGGNSHGPRWQAAAQALDGGLHYWCGVEDLDMEIEDNVQRHNNIVRQRELERIPKAKGMVGMGYCLNIR